MFFIIFYHSQNKFPVQAATLTTFLYSIHNRFIIWAKIFTLTLTIIISHRNVTYHFLSFTKQIIPSNKLHHFIISAKIFTLTLTIFFIHRNVIYYLLLWELCFCTLRTLFLYSENSVSALWELCFCTLRTLFLHSENSVSVLWELCFCTLRTLFLHSENSVSVLWELCFCTLRTLFLYSENSVSVLWDLCLCTLRPLFVQCVHNRFIIWAKIFTLTLTIFFIHRNVIYYFLSFTKRIPSTKQLHWELCLCTVRPLFVYCETSVCVHWDSVCTVFTSASWCVPGRGPGGRWRNRSPASRCGRAPRCSPPARARSAAPSRRRHSS